MSSVASKERTIFFETVLSSPGMAEKCKIVLHASRQQVLLLGRLIETLWQQPESSTSDELIRAIAKDSLQDFKVLHEEILRKAGLTDFYEKLKSLS